MPRHVTTSPYAIVRCGFRPYSIEYLVRWGARFTFEGAVSDATAEGPWHLDDAVDFCYEDLRVAGLIGSNDREAKRWIRQELRERYYGRSRTYAA